LRNRRKFDTAIDADHFKSYNDSFGHQAGDEVLVGIAICISDSVRRAGDCVARYGGEEFAVLLPGLSSEEALRVAETIRLKVLKWFGDTEITTVSIDVASLMPDTTADWSKLVNGADKALYAAKAAGRNCCVLASVSKLSLVA
jgi:diguanylate cyclase (GGDEF)-like protein